MELSFPAAINARLFANCGPVRAGGTTSDYTQPCYVKEIAQFMKRFVVFIYRPSTGDAPAAQRPGTGFEEIENWSSILLSAITVEFRILELHVQAQ